MADLFAYLFELNAVLVILYTAFKIFFERDGNFVSRRVYLLGVALLSLVLPLVPAGLRMPLGGVVPVTITLDEVTITGTAGEAVRSGNISFGEIMLLIYLFFVAAGLTKLIIQLVKVTLAIVRSDRLKINGSKVLASSTLHASSFFGYVFLHPETGNDESIAHILAHENTHKREFHSLDRILAEFFVIINWFNPLAWLYRKSVIENLEYLADSAVMRQGTDSTKYQLSILNQYIGSASISNQFSSQIKNRINMLNKKHSIRSHWKLLLLVPIVALAFGFLSCTEKEQGATLSDGDGIEAQVQGNQAPEVFYIVEEMPTFNGGDAGPEFRKFIAQNVRYPKEAADNGAGGRIIVKFIVNKEGKVVIPEPETVARIEGKPLDEVVVVTFRNLSDEDQAPKEEYIQLLKDEAIRVIESSPDWEPGVQRGKKVNVMFTFPINFVLQ